MHDDNLSTHTLSSEILFKGVTKGRDAQRRDGAWHHWSVTNGKSKDSILIFKAMESVFGCIQNSYRERPWKPLSRYQNYASSGTDRMLLGCFVAQSASFLEVQVRLNFQVRFEHHGRILHHLVIIPTRIQTFLHGNTEKIAHAGVQSQNQVPMKE